SPPCHTASTPPPTGPGARPAVCVLPGSEVTPSAVGSPFRNLAHGPGLCLSGTPRSRSGRGFLRLGAWGWRSKELLDALGEVAAREGKFGFGFAKVAGGDRPGDVGHQLEDAGRP